MPAAPSGAVILSLPVDKDKQLPRHWNNRLSPDGKNIARLGNGSSGSSIGSIHFGQVGDRSIGFQLIKISSPGL